MGMTSDEAFSSIFAKSVEQAKASAEMREKDIDSNGLYWYGKALEYKQMHEMAVKREQHLEGMLKDRTTERDYHLRMADKLAEIIRELRPALVEAERFMAYFAGETGGSFVGPGTPQSCLAQIRAALARS